MNVATTLQHVYESWWFDPLTATFGFIVPVYVYTYYEIQTGSSVYTTFDQFLTSRGTGEDKGRRPRGARGRRLTAAGSTGRGRRRG